VAGAVAHFEGRKTPTLVRHERTDRTDTAERSETADRKDPTEKAEPNEPTDPIDSAEQAIDHFDCSDRIFVTRPSWR
jgi:hypothetical protein